MTTYLPGSFFAVDVKGPGGWWIGVAQALAGAASRYKHAGLILNADGTILEAEPSGARLANISEYAGGGLLISDAPVRAEVAAANLALDGDLDDVGLEGIYRDHIVAEARKLVGTPYSWLDYAAIGLLHLHLPSRWIRQRVESSGHLICSALVDRVYMNAGVHLFSDGRLPGDVMPADLASYAEDWAAKS